MATVQVLEGKARKIHQEAIFVNGLDPTWPDRFDSEYAGKLKAGGVTAVNSTIPMPWDNFAYTVGKFGEWYRRLDETRADGAIQARSVKDIRNAHKEGKVAAIFGAQTAYGIED